MTEVLEAASGESAVSTKEKTFVDEVDPAAPSTLCEEKLTAMKKLLEAMPSTYCSYDVDFTNLKEKHEPSAGEDINRKSDFVFVDPLYSVRKDRNADNSENDVLTSEDTR